MTKPTHITATLTLSNGNTVTVPTSWSDVSLAQYLQYLETIETSLGESAANENLFWVNVLAHFTGVSMDDLQEMQTSDLLQACQCLHFLAEPLTNFEQFKKEYSVNSSFIIIEGKQYDYPTALPSIPFQKQSFGDFAESMTYWSQGGELLKGKVSVLPQMMAVLLKRQGEKIPLAIDTRSAWVDQRAEFWKGQNMMHGWEFLFFFLKILQPSKTTIRAFSEGGSKSQARQKKKGQRNTKP